MFTVSFVSTTQTIPALTRLRAGGGGADIKTSSFTMISPGVTPAPTDRWVDVSRGRTSNLLVVTRLAFPDL